MFLLRRQFFLFLLAFFFGEFRKDIKEYSTSVGTAVFAKRMRQNFLAALFAGGQCKLLDEQMHSSLPLSRFGPILLWNRHIAHYSNICDFCNSEKSKAQSPKSKTGLEFGFCH